MLSVNPDKFQLQYHCHLDTWLRYQLPQLRQEMLSNFSWSQIGIDKELVQGV